MSSTRPWLRIVAIATILASLIVSVAPAAATAGGEHGYTSRAAGDAITRSRAEYAGPATGIQVRTLQLPGDSLPTGMRSGASQPDDLWPSSIIDTDERFRLSPANPLVANLDINGGTYLCSATFIGYGVLLTAAHCLWGEDYGGYITDARVTPGKDADSEPYGSSYATNVWVPTNWINSNGTASEWDWGLLVVDPNAPINSVGYYTIGVLRDASLGTANFNPAIIGYPGDKPYGTQWMGQKSSFLDIEPFLLYYDIDTYGGQSGSAVFRGADSMVIGIHTNGSPTYNIAQRIDAEMLDHLNNGCVEMGCTIASYTEPVQPNPSDPSAAFHRTWERTDQPVVANQATRSWMWGDGPFTDIIPEEYAEAPGQTRAVQYFDKSRMEDNSYRAPDAPWDVSNGLLVVELVSGQMQIGDSAFAPRLPAQVNVAGDGDDPTGPTYATIAGLRDDEPWAAGTVITARVDRAGSVTHDPNLAGYGVTASELVDVPGIRHRIAQPFWQFMNASGTIYVDGQYLYANLFENPYYATGLPISEAYWANVKVGGTYRDVLLQCFERRCLTYTPGNPAEWQVEMGNVGLHYYTWRYQQPSNDIPADQEPLVTWNIADWEPFADGSTTITPTGNALHVRTITDNPIFPWWDVPTSDYSVSVDVRLVDDGGTDGSTACVVARLSSTFDADYALCIWPDGTVDIIYEYVDANGYQFEYLVESGPSQHLGPATDWNTLKIVVLGDRLWFLINGHLIASVTHSGLSLGDPGMYVLSLDGNWVEYAFTNFNVYSLK